VVRAEVANLKEAVKSAEVTNPMFLDTDHESRTPFPRHFSASVASISCLADVPFSPRCDRDPARMTQSSRNLSLKVLQAYSRLVTRSRKDANGST
jgi:hypothetical protein